jgi:hypothetical protein
MVLELTRLSRCARGVHLEESAYRRELDVVAQDTLLRIVTTARLTLDSAGIVIGSFWQLGRDRRHRGDGSASDQPPSAGRTTPVTYAATGDARNRHTLASYFSNATFSDPDANVWVLQEVTTRLPGRIEADATSFGSATDLASAFRRAEAAHGEHEKRTGQRDANWPDWYAEYMVAEQAGTEPPR